MQYYNTTVILGLIDKAVHHISNLKNIVVVLSPCARVCLFGLTLDCLKMKMLLPCGAALADILPPLLLGFAYLV
jgi:hypothetical protein